MLLNTGLADGQASDDRLRRDLPTAPVRHRHLLERPRAGAEGGRPVGAHPVGGDQRGHLDPPYGPEVRWRIRQGQPESYRAAAEQLNAAAVDVVCLQHEFGLYGIWGDPFDDHLTPFLEVAAQAAGHHAALACCLTRPPSVRAAVQRIAQRSDQVVVMAERARVAAGRGLWHRSGQGVRHPARRAAGGAARPNADEGALGLTVARSSRLWPGRSAQRARVHDRAMRRSRAATRTRCT